MSRTEAKVVKFFARSSRYNCDFQQNSSTINKMSLKCFFTLFCFGNVLMQPNKGPGANLTFAVSGVFEIYRVIAFPCLLKLPNFDRFIRGKENL